MVEQRDPTASQLKILETIEDLGSNKIESIMNKVYQTGTIPKFLSRSIFVTLPKYAGTTDCELHRTISLMSHISTTILKILMRRMRRSIQEEVAGVYCLTEARGSTNVTFIRRSVLQLKTF